MNIKIGILNVPKHGNKHNLIHFVTVCLTGEAASLDGRLVEVLVKINVKQISFLWFWDLFILLPSQMY